MNGKRLGREIARAVIAAEMQEAIAEAMARAAARWAVVDLLAMLPAEAFENEGGMVGTFATGGPVTCSPFDREVPEFVVPARGLNIRVAGAPIERLEAVYIDGDQVYPCRPAQWPADVVVATPREVSERG